MKFDMGKAWSEATEMLGNNFGLVATILGLFYFVPGFAIAILFPEIANPQPPQTPPGASPDEAFSIMSDFLMQSWAEGWPFLLATTLLQYVGAISVLALFRQGGSPTVGDALKAGVVGMPTYIATTIITAIAAGIIIGVPLGLAFALSPIVGALLILPLIVFMVYISIKLILVPAIIGMEGELNPITVLKRSWGLTKGNSIRIFLFVFVLAIVAGLFVLVINLAVTTVFLAFGGTAATIGGGFVSSLTSAVFGGLFLLVIGAIYRQLSGAAGGANIEQTFD